MITLMQHMFLSSRLLPADQAPARYRNEKKKKEEAAAAQQSEANTNDESKSAQAHKMIERLIQNYMPKKEEDQAKTAATLQQREAAREAVEALLDLQTSGLEIEELSSQITPEEVKNGIPLLASILPHLLDFIKDFSHHSSFSPAAQEAAKALKLDVLVHMLDRMDPVRDLRSIFQIESEFIRELSTVLKQMAFANAMHELGIDKALHLNTDAVLMLSNHPLLLRELLQDLELPSAIKEKWQLINDSSDAGARFMMFFLSPMEKTPEELQACKEIGEKFLEGEVSLEGLMAKIGTSAPLRISLSSISAFRNKGLPAARMANKAALYALEQMQRDMEDRPFCLMQFIPSPSNEKDIFHKDASVLKHSLGDHAYSIVLRDKSDKQAYLKTFLVLSEIESQFMELTAKVEDFLAKFLKESPEITEIAAKYEIDVNKVVMALAKVQLVFNTYLSIQQTLLSLSVLTENNTFASASN